MGALPQANPGDYLQGDRLIVERHLAAVLPGDGSPVSSAMRYAVLGGGQRIRPLLAVRTARMLKAEQPAVLTAAAAVELLHCASLIVDDLPCMDNALARRGRPATHVAFGEPTALLAAFGLVALSARCVLDCDVALRERARLVEFQSLLLRALDSGGLIEGQSLDLELSGAERERHRAHINDLKTVPLFVLALRAGMLFSAAPPRQRAALLRFGREFGAAFQMADDLADREAADAAPVCEQLESARRCLDEFGPRAGGLCELIDYLHEAVTEKNRCHR